MAQLTSIELMALHWNMMAANTTMLTMLPSPLPTLWLPGCEVIYWLKDWKVGRLEGQEAKKGRMTQAQGRSGRRETTAANDFTFSFHPGAWSDTRQENIRMLTGGVTDSLKDPACVGTFERPQVR